jgi:hypothetical protein
MESNQEFIADLAIRLSYCSASRNSSDHLGLYWTLKGTCDQLNSKAERFFSSMTYFWKPDSAILHEV